MSARWNASLPALSFRPAIPLAFAFIGVIGACSSSDPPSSFAAFEDAGMQEDGSPGSVDAAPPPHFDPDAGCEDCEWFPTECLPTTMCNAGVAIDPFSTLNGVTVTDKGVWAVGSQGLVVQHDGTTWSTKQLDDPDTMMHIIQRPGGELWAIGGPLYAGPKAEVAGGSGFARTTMPPNGLISSLWSAADGPDVTSTTSAYAVADYIYRIDVDESGSPSIFPFFITDFASILTAIHGAPDGMLWAVGRIGNSYRLWDLDAGYPQSDSLNTQTFAVLNAVWPISSNDVWAVGDEGTIRHYTGNSRLWDIVESPVETNLRAIWAGSTSDVWAVGDASVVLHYDGKSWQRVPVSGLGTRHPDLGAVWGSGDGRVFAVGGNVVLSLGAKATGGAN